MLKSPQHDMSWASRRRHVFSVFHRAIERNIWLYLDQKSCRSKSVTAQCLSTYLPCFYCGCMTTSKSSTTGKGTKNKYPDLHKRTCKFARDARDFVRKTPRTIASLGDCRYLVKTSGSIGSSYIDADDANSGQEFMRSIFDCRKQSRLSSHWLSLLEGNLEERSEEARASLAKEAEELERIFSAIIGKVVSNNKKAKKEKVA